MACVDATNTLVTTDTISIPVNDDKNLSNQEKLSQILTNRYSVSLPSFFQGTFDQALMSTLYDPKASRPLVLYIHDDRSIAAHIFPERVLCSESINSYLAKEFTIWGWNLTKENYYDLLTILVSNAGEEIAAIIDSSPIDIYPLMICLTFNRNQIKVETVILGTMSNSEVLARLIEARDAFDTQKTPFSFTTDFNYMNNNLIDNDWFIPTSTVTEVEKDSEEFRRVANDFDGGASLIIRIDRIENTTWLMHYFNQKESIDTRIGHDATEKLVFHGCPYTAAEQILRQGFDHKRIGKNGVYYGHGFYFSTSRLVSDKYAFPDPTTGEKRILMCRILVGRSCQGNPSMVACPSNYDSTTGETNIFVVYSNRQVLPEYLITYK